MKNDNIIIKNDINLPKILLIIPFGACNNIFDSFLNNFDGYCLIFYDMNKENLFDPYITLKKQSTSIIENLKSHGIDNFELIFSISLGGILAINIFSNNELSIKHCIIDSTPLLNLDKLKKLIVQPKIINMVDDIEIIIKENPYIFQKISQNAIDILKKSSLNSIKSLSEEILSFDFPKIDITRQKNLVFRYGTDDLCYQSIKTLKSTYRKSTIYVKANYKHCQEFIEDNSKYIEFIKSIINN